MNIVTSSINLLCIYCIICDDDAEYRYRCNVTQYHLYVVNQS